MDEQWQPPWRYSWEREAPLPPPPPPPPPHRSARGLWAAGSALGGALLLGGLLATCGADGDSDRPASDAATGRPAAAADPGPWATGPVPWHSATRSPGASPEPGSGPDSSPSPDSPSATADPGPSSATPRHSARPRTSPGASRSASAPAAGEAGVPALSSVQVCAEAERLGRWQPGSEEAQVCRSLYGG